MAIWTSRYSNRELKSGRYFPVGISLGQPKWPLGYEVRNQCFSLAPKRYMLDIEDKEKYRTAYIRKIEDIGTAKIIAMVRKMAQEAASERKELVLLCYEDVRDGESWCHRTMFAEWWKEKTGEEIKELADPSEPKVKRITEEKKQDPKPQEPELHQMSIFDMLAVQ